MDTDLTDTNDDFYHIIIQRIREIVDIRNDVVDQVRLVSHALEEQVEVDTEYPEPCSNTPGGEPTPVLAFLEGAADPGSIS